MLHFPGAGTLSLNILLSPAKMLPPYHLPVIEHRLPPTCSVHSQELALSSPAWDGQCHQDFFSFSLCTSQSKRVLPASHGQEDPESKNSECVSLCLWIRCHLKIWKESCSCTCLKYVHHLKFFKQSSWYLGTLKDFFVSAIKCFTLLFFFLLLIKCMGLLGSFTLWRT